MTRSEIREAVLTILEEIAPDDDLSGLKDDVAFRDQLELDSMDFLDIVKTASLISLPISCSPTPFGRRSVSRSPCGEPAWPPSKSILSARKVMSPLAVTTLSAVVTDATSNFSFTDANGFAVGNVDTQDGINVTDGNVILVSSTGNITINDDGSAVDDVVAGGTGTVSITANGDEALTVAVPVQSVSPPVWGQLPHRMI